MYLKVNMALLLLCLFQDIETAFTETMLQTESFTIIQNAFAIEPKQLGSGAQTYLDRLKVTY